MNRLKEQDKKYWIDDLTATRDEYEFAIRLVEENIDFIFQPPSICLIKGFRGSLKNYRDTTYTPDFKIALNGRNIYVEIKGFMRADNSLKHKLADKILTDMGYEYFVLKWKGSIKEGTKGFYDYSNANFKRWKEPLNYEFFNKLLNKI